MPDPFDALLADCEARLQRALARFDWHVLSIVRWTPTSTIYIGLSSAPYLRAYRFGARWYEAAP